MKGEISIFCQPPPPHGCPLPPRHPFPIPPPTHRRRSPASGGDGAGSLPERARHPHHPHQKKKKYIYSINHNKHPPLRATSTTHTHLVAAPPLPAFPRGLLLPPPYPPPSPPTPGCRRGRYGTRLLPSFPRDSSRFVDGKPRFRTQPSPPGAFLPTPLGRCGISAGDVRDVPPPQPVPSRAVPFCRTVRGCKELLSIGEEGEGDAEGRWESGLGHEGGGRGFRGRDHSPSSSS